MVFLPVNLKKEGVSEVPELQCGYSRFLSPSSLYLYLFVSTGRQSTTTPRSCILETLRIKSERLPVDHRLKYSICFHYDLKNSEVITLTLQHIWGCYHLKNIEEEILCLPH